MRRRLVRTTWTGTRMNALVALSMRHGGPLDGARIDCHVRAVWGECLARATDRSVAALWCRRDRDIPGCGRTGPAPRSPRRDGLLDRLSAVDREDRIPARSRCWSR